MSISEVIVQHRLLPWMPRQKVIGYLALPMLLVGIILFVTGCAGTPTVTAAEPTPDCNLAPDLVQLEVVTPLPEDHVIKIPELRALLKSHMLHEKQIADRSNDKTAFVNNNCRGKNGTGSAAGSTGTP